MNLTAMNLTAMNKYWHYATVLCVVYLSGCGQSPSDGLAPPVKALPAAPAVEELQKAQRAMQRWAQSCALCHVDGTGGAPRIGRAEDWLPRLAKGEAVLLQHTLEGYNNMPPLGYCMSCDTADFKLMISFMTDAVSPAQADDLDHPGRQSQ